MVVREIGFQNPTEMALTEDDDVVETLPPYGSHEAFSIWILRRRPRCREDLLDAEALDATAELVAEDAVAVPNHCHGRRLGVPVAAGSAVPGPETGGRTIPS